MLTFSATTALASSMFIVAAVPPAIQKTVTVKGVIQPDDARADHFTVAVQFDIDEGWHTYDDVGEGAEVRTSLELKLPEGATAVGDWSRPRGIDGVEAHSKVYVGHVEFTKSVLIEPAAYGKKIDVLVSYQACTDDYCNPPQNKTVSIAIPENGLSSSGIFDAPIRLMVKDAPLNAAAKIRFPSPAIFDVDGDGEAELVIGSLMGGVGFYENLNASGAGDPVWSARQPLKSSTGVPIRTSNW